MNKKEYIERLNKIIPNNTDPTVTYPIPVLFTNIEFHKGILINTFKNINFVKDFIIRDLQLDRYPNGKYIKNKSDVYKWLPELTSGVDLKEWITLIYNLFNYFHLIAPSQKEEIINILYYIQQNILKLRNPARSILQELPNINTVLNNTGIYLDNIVNIFEKYDNPNTIIKRLRQRIPILAKFNLILYGLRPLTKI